MPKRSAGLLPYRWRGEWLEVFLVHPGGPFWATKDDGAWSIAKGEYLPDEDPQEAAFREFAEEVGYQPPPGRPYCSASSASRAGRSSPRSPCRLTSRWTRCAATPSRWSGRHGPGYLGSSPRSTARSG